MTSPLFYHDWSRRKRLAVGFPLSWLAAAFLRALFILSMGVGVFLDAMHRDTPSALPGIDAILAFVGLLLGADVPPFVFNAVLRWRIEWPLLLWFAAPTALVAVIFAMRPNAASWFFLTFAVWAWFALSISMGI